MLAHLPYIEHMGSYGYAVCIHMLQRAACTATIPFHGLPSDRKTAASRTCKKPLEGLKNNFWVHTLPWTRFLSGTWPEWQMQVRPELWQTLPKFIIRYPCLGGSRWSQRSAGHPPKSSPLCRTWADPGLLDPAALGTNSCENQGKPYMASLV